MKKSFSESIEILKKSDPLRISENNAIIIKKLRFNNKIFIDIRKHYLDKELNYKPTSVGIWIPIEDADDPKFIETVIQIMTEFSK